MEYDPETIRSRLRELAFLNSAATIQYRAAKQVAAAEWTEYHFGGGLREFVTWTNRDREAMHEPIYVTKEVTFLAHSLGFVNVNPPMDILLLSNLADRYEVE